MVWLGSGLRRSRPFPPFRLFGYRCALERVEHIAAQGVDAGDLEALVVRHRISSGLVLAMKEKGPLARSFSLMARRGRFVLARSKQAGVGSAA
jgi:hypothetical protein